MNRSLGGLALLALAVALTACTPAAGGASPESASATPSPTPSGPTLDGDWVVQAGGSQGACIGVDYRTLQVASAAGSIAVGIAGSGANTPALTGPAEIDGDRVTITLKRSAPTKDELDITGMLGDDGVIRGTAEAGGIHPGGETGYTCTFPVIMVRAVTGGDVPAFDTIHGTWCSAADPQTCMTIADGRISFGDDPPEATLDAPEATGFGQPCYISAATPTQPGGGFVLYFCPKGVVVQAGGGGVQGDIVAEHDDIAFDRLYLTQNPPYLGVYFRQEDMAAAMRR